MRRRRKPAPPPSHQRWLVSYADFVTLLFAFFVVLYASSQVDQRKVGRLALAIQVAFQELGIFQASTTRVPLDVAEPMPFSTVQAIENQQRSASLGRVVPQLAGALGGGHENGDLAQLQLELEAALSPEIARKEISVRREPDGLVISLREVGFFQSGSAQMKASSQPAFDRIAVLLRERKYRLRIEGHTDNVPIHNSQFSSNWELSTARATEIVRVLIVRDGFEPLHLSAAGYAEYHPIASNHTNEGRAMNRRVDVVILGQDRTAAPVAQAGAQTSAEASVTAKTAKPSPAAALKPTALRTAGGSLQH
ncbi:MAG: flagellar motor protein MotB [Terriglobales bacterium]